MTIETKYSTGDKVVIIDSNKIVSLPIHGIEIQATKHYVIITYELMVSRAATAMDKDKFTHRREEDVYGSIEEVLEVFSKQVSKSA